MKFTNTSPSIKKTLDIQHNMKLCDFQEKQYKITNMKNRIIEIENKIHIMEEEKKMTIINQITFLKIIYL